MTSFSTRGINNGVTASTDSLTDLLGDTRARVVELVRDQPRSVAALAAELGLSEVAIRRHLAVLEEEDLVAGETVRRQGPGRPGTIYRTTDRAARLFPDRTAEFANELLDFLTDRVGPDAVREFLRWRQERVKERYASALAGTDDRDDQVARLADLLSEDGFPSTVHADADGLALTQGHCAIREVAEAHPEVCQIEAEMFEDLLGVGVSRRVTLARGANQCVCEIPADVLHGRTTGRTAQQTAEQAAGQPHEPTAQAASQPRNAARSETDK